ncbi:uncharacterized protein FIESC28_10051 [Fusarium coffeatum]|uniref:Uncharacterized protein n=1 Tax=Fusarium coffeatum TaxID=231269 RepID=A0A366QW00_9HYPO|nr:uncharacterized protein FIESC28_10051 [Fusarium coffeatum]RBR09043.1 hypothetical protein FIESC28_10051 [Fusarium coffeatum]
MIKQPPSNNTATGITQGDTHQQLSCTTIIMSALLATREALFPHMTDEYFERIVKRRGHGLPNQYSLDETNAWMDRVLHDLRSSEHDLESERNTIRHACIRLRCVKCRRPCQEIQDGSFVESHRPCIFPCGHIIGSSCYEDMILLYTYTELQSPTCP